MERQKHPSNLAWAALAAGVAAYDFNCPHGETMSEAVDRALERPISRVLAVGAVVMTAAHLLNLLPPEIDPLHRIAKFKDRVYTTPERSL